MGENLYKKDGSGIIGDTEIDNKISALVKDILTTHSEYNNAELELYVIERVMGEFLQARVYKRMEVMKKEKGIE